MVAFLGAVSTRGLGDSQWKYSCPVTTSPISLTTLPNLQVSVGGQNNFQSNLFYT
jgi:hypothetical protein